MGHREGELRKAQPAKPSPEFLQALEALKKGYASEEVAASALAVAEPDVALDDELMTEEDRAEGEEAADAVMDELAADGGEKEDDDDDGSEKKKE